MFLSRAHVVLFGCLSLCTWLSHARPAGAQARPALAGRWSAGVLVERWNVGAWGDACGPHPTDRTLPGGESIVRQEGAELVITGGGAYRTDECWERLPGVTRTSHSVSDHTWKTRCTNAANDPRHAVITTTLTETETSIHFDETGEYQFVIQNQNCSAAVRRNRTYSLLPASSETARPSSSAQAEAVAIGPPAAEPTPPAERNCARKGDPVRVEVKPAHKILRPGDRFSFRASVVDAQGCPLDVKPSWSLVTAVPGVSLGSPGSIVASDNAVEGRAELLVAVGGRGAHVFVDVVSPARYAGMLRDMQGEAGEPDDVAVGIVSAPALGGATAVAEDTAGKRKAIFVGVVGAMAALLGVLGFVMLRRSRNSGVSGPEPAGSNEAPRLDGSPFHPAPLPSAPLPSAPLPAPTFLGAPFPAAPFPRSSLAPGNSLAPATPMVSYPGGLAHGPAPTGSVSAIAPGSNPSESPQGKVFNAETQQPGPPQGIGAAEEIMMRDATQAPGSKDAQGVRPPACPTCHREFPSGSGFCPYDGSKLVPGQGDTEEAQRNASSTGGTCPACSLVYGPGYTQCAADGSELVPNVVLAPAGAQDEPSGLAKRGKICPTCGARFDSAASFCGKDGTALVLVN